MRILPLPKCFFVCFSAWALSISLLLFPVKEAAAAGSIIQEFVLPDEISAPNSIALDAAGNVWFAEKVGKRLSVYDPQKNEFRSFPIPSAWGSVGPARIAVGPKGKIWFNVTRWMETVDNVDFLGEFSPADGSFKKHELSSKTGAGELLTDQHRVIPEELLIDAKGIVWLLVPGENALYSYDPAASILKAHVIPTVNCYPRGLSIDGDGVLWFSEANANKIGKFDPKSATFAEYDIPTAFATAGETAVDGDGNVWFVEMRTNRLGVFYPALERFDEALLPAARSLPSDIAIDGDGKIWFLEYLASKVGLFLPKEALFREFVIPTTGSLPGSLVIDKKRGLLWFSETSTDAKRLGLLDIGNMDKTAAGAAAGTGGVLKEKSVSGEGGGQKIMFALGALLLAAGGAVFLIARRRRKGGA